jgi:alpha-L-rhamnosidase
MFNKHNKGNSNKMNTTETFQNCLSEAKWISIPPLTDDDFCPLHGAQWIGPARDGAARPDRLMAVSVDFMIPAGKTIKSAVFNYWMEGRPYFDSGLPQPIPADWSFVVFNGQPARDFSGGRNSVDAGFLLMGRLPLDLRAPGFMGITTFLREGANTISFLSWMRMEQPSVVAALDVVFGDGETLHIRSDRNWRVQTLDVETAAGCDWHRRLDRLEPALEVCAFGQEPWSDVRARLNHPVPPVVLRRRFELPAKAIAYARIESTAIGVYDMELNGEKVGDDFMAPGWTDTRKTIHVQNYDAANLLRSGINEWTITVAKGWAGSAMQNQPSLRECEKAFRARLTVRYADGEEWRVVTDGDAWEGCTGEVVDSEIYFGEMVDHTRERVWRSAVTLPERDIRIIAETTPQGRCIQSLAPVELFEREPGVWIADFGRQLGGVVALRVNEPRGTRVTVGHAEVLRKDKKLGVWNHRAAVNVDRYVCPCGEITLRPRFTFRGFRWIEIRGVSGKLDPDQIRALAYSSLTKQTFFANFENSDLDRLMDAVRRTAQVNLLSIPADCQQRSERLPWSGSLLPFAAACAKLFDCETFFQKHFEDCLDAAHPSGSFPDFAPCGGGAGPDSTYGWGDVAVLIPWLLWRDYGNSDFARRHWYAIRRYLDQRDATADAEGMNINGTYGDWLTMEPKTPHAILGPVFQAWTHRMAVDMAQSLGREDDARHHRRRFDEIGEVWRRRHLHGDGTIESDTQAIYAFAWNAGLIPQSLKPLTAAAFKASMARRDNRAYTGILGTMFLLDALMDAGLEDIAWQILTQHGFPSYQYFFDKGLTTIPEWWDSFPEHQVMPEWKKFTGDGDQGEVFASLCHYELGSVLDAVIQYVFGFRQAPDSSGYRRVIIHPRFTDRLPSARGRFESVHGVYRLEWKREGTNIQFIIEIPDGCSGELMPIGSNAAPIALPAGRTEITMNET